MKIYPLLLSSLLFLASSCQRTRSEICEDTKTATRYVGKGFQTFLGKHSDSHEYAALDTWEQDYEPLAGSERYQATTAFEDYGPAKESPGDPGSSIPGISGFKDPAGTFAAIFKRIHFETDNYSIKGNENIDVLRTMAHYLAQHPKTYIFIEGHADERGAAAYNLSLGSKRANAIRNFLIQNGATPDQLFTISYGKERPLAMGHGEETWKINRRGQFKIYEK